MKSSTLEAELELARERLRETQTALQVQLAEKTSMEAELESAGTRLRETQTTLQVQLAEKDKWQRMVVDLQEKVSWERVWTSITLKITHSVVSLLALCLPPYLPQRHKVILRQPKLSLRHNSNNSKRLLRYTHTHTHGSTHIMSSPNSSLQARRYCCHVFNCWRCI